MSDQSEAAKRAAARKAKILARGNAGLNKLAQTARGDEAQALYGDDTPTSRPATPSTTSTAKPTAPTSTSTSGSGPSWAPPPSTRSAGQPSGGMNEEQRRMQEQLAAMFGGVPGGGGGGFGGDAGSFPGLGMGAGGDAPDIQQLLSSMFGGMPPGGQPGQNLLGDLDDPAGLGSGAANPFAALGNMPGMEGLGGMPGMGGLGGMPGFGGPVKRGKVEKYFPLVHFLSIVVLALFAVVWWEPSLRATRYGRLGALNLSWADRWSGLAAGRGTLRVIKNDVLGGLEVLPIFWAFTTLELILQTTRFFVLKSPPAPHSLISNFLPLMPPGLARPLVTGSRYLSLIFQTYKDGALLVFLIGLAISVAPYLSASPVRI